MDSQQVFLMPQTPSNAIQQTQPQRSTSVQQVPQCAICGTAQKLLRCAKCKTVYYCSTDHQHTDWPSHKKDCRMLAKQRNNNNRLQQLTNGCSAINISSSIGQSNPASVVHTASLVSTTRSNCVNRNHNDKVQSVIDNRPVQTVLGTHENEILQSKAQVIRNNSNNSEYINNFDANSTTIEQIHIIENGSNPFIIETNPYSNHSLFNDDNSYEQQTKNQEQSNMNAYPLDRNDIELSTNSEEVQGNIIQSEPQQQNGLYPTRPESSLAQELQQQNSLQYPVPQFSNYLINQHEKSSSYQIGTSILAESIFEDINERRYDELCRNIINDMNLYGLSVVDDFLGLDKGLQVLDEVQKMYSAGVFEDGQLANKLKTEQDLRTIRGDKITWVKGIEPGCSNVGYLINQIDAVICRANTMRNNGKLGNYTIKERTKAMVACYPGSGSHYVMHVDNPNKDGRVITAIYYLNRNWDSMNNGGILRIFPEQTKSVADIEPKFDRLLFFWSDKRNPHEVQPAHSTRYAITVWYFDANEREVALNRWKTSQIFGTDQSSSPSTSTTALSSYTQQTATSNSFFQSDMSENVTTASSIQDNTNSANLIQNSSGRPIQVVLPNSYK